MAFAPDTSPFITTALDNVDLPNSQVLAAGAGLQIISSGPGGNVTINPTQNLLSLTQIAADGILSINHSTNTIFTRTLTSDGTLTITDANGVNGSPLFSVTPQSQVQLIQASANGGSIVGSAPTLNFEGAGDTNVSVVNEGSFINVVISSTGGGGGGVTNIATGTGLTGGPITSTGTISIANTSVTAGTYTNPSSVVVNAQGQITSIASGGGGGGVPTVQGTANQILINGSTTATSAAAIFTIPNAFTAPGSITATTSVTTPILSITGAFNNPFSVQPGSNGQVLSCSTGGVLAWINNGSGGSGVSSVGISSPLNTITVGSSTTNPITSTGTLHVDLSASGISPGSFGTPASINVNAYGIVTAITALPYALPTSTGTSGQVITYPSSGGQTTWQTPGGGGGGVPSITTTANQILVNGGVGPISSAATLTIPNAFTAPGSITATTGITATTRVTTPALTMTDAATYTYSLPVTNGTSGQFLQSIGGGQCIWASGGGGGGGVTNIQTGTGLTGGPITSTGTISLQNTTVIAGSYSSANITVNAQGQITSATNGGGGGGTVNSVAVTGSNSTGLVITPTTGNVTVGWDTTQDAEFPQSASFNNTNADPATQFILPVNEGAPGYFITYPDTGTQTYWSANYVTQVLGTANQINASAPSSGVVTLSFPSTQIFPGDLTTTSTVSASAGFDILASSPLTFWPSNLPTAPGGLLTSSTGGSLSWTDFDMTPTTISTTFNFSYDGATTAPANVTLSIAASGDSVNIRIALGSISAFVCNLTSLEFISTTVVPAGYIPAPGSIEYISLGSIPIYDSTAGILYYGQCYLEGAASLYYMRIALWCQAGSTTAPYQFTSGHTYLFGSDNDVTGVSYASFNYPINIHL